MDEAETDPEGRCVGAEEAADEDELVRWWGSGWARDGLGVLALALEDPLPVRVRVASGAGGAG